MELEAIEAELARRSLKRFVHVAWRILEPSTPLVWNWHLDVLCDELEAISAGKRKRLIINVPPGTMKSLLVSVFWPAWEWATKPQLRILTASYGDRVAERDNVKMRDILLSPWYQRQYGLTLRGDQATKQKFINSESGWRICTTTKGAGTGDHPDRLIIDDPHKAQDATSELMLEMVSDWYSRTVSTRGATRGTAIVLIMQRLSMQDLTAYLEGLGGWRQIMFPMEYEPDRAHYLDKREVKGELLWPDLFTREKVDLLKRELGPYGAAGQLQQRPAPEGGGLFRRDWFNIVSRSEVPPLSEMTLCRGWDCAATQDDGDFTCGALMGYHPPTGRFYILDIIHGQWSAGKVDRRMESAAKADGIAVRIVEEQEPGSGGKAVVTKRALDLVGYDYTAKPSTQKKEIRARPFRSQCEAGNVYMVRASWNETALQELEVFDRGSYDDIVDGLSTAFNECASGAEIRQVDVLW
jgi:predicted phage terminase large subunit-like protein